MEQFEIIALTYKNARDIMNNTSEQKVYDRSTEVMQMLEIWFQDGTHVKDLRHSWERHIRLYCQEHKLHHMLDHLASYD